MFCLSVQLEMRRQDHSFNARLTQMTKNIEEVNTACWHHKLCCLQSSDAYACSWQEEACDHTVHLTNQTALSDEYLPVRSSSCDAVHRRRSNKPQLRVELPNQTTLPAMHNDADRCSSESPLPGNRNSFGSIYEQVLHKQTSVRSLPASPVQGHNGGLKPTMNNAGQPNLRRGSLGTWLMRKFQHN